MSGYGLTTLHFAKAGGESLGMHKVFVVPRRGELVFIHKVRYKVVQVETRLPNLKTIIWLRPRTSLLIERPPEIDHRPEEQEAPYLTREQAAELTYADGLRRAAQIAEEVLDQTSKPPAMGALRHLASRLDRELAEVEP